MIFISHAERDEATASALANFLAQAMQISVADIVRSGSTSGADIAQITRRLREDIASSDAVVALLSPDVFASRSVIFELGAAWAANRMIFTFFMPGIDFREVPEILANYPSVELDATDAHISIMDMARDIAEYLDVPERKDGAPLDAIELLVSTARSGEEQEDDDAESYGFGTPTGSVSLNDSGEYCSVVIVYEEVSLGSSTGGRVVVRVSWEDLFKSFASYLEHAQDDDYISKLIVELCKTKDSKFEQNCRYGICKKPSVEPYSYQRIIERFAGRGFIEQTKPPRSAFGSKTARRVYWHITDAGTTYLRSLLAKQKSLQEWYGNEKHIQRGAIRNLDKQI